ncbi:hypothetical protein IWW50_002286 [Coemansia erecta]|nr:hypothetical protein IWW50_002286 [Coemansia erecta]
MEFGCLSTSTKLRMFGVSFATLILGFIPFFNVWFVYRVKPLFVCWRLFSDDVGSKGLYNGVSEAGMQIEYVTANSKSNSMRIQSNEGLAQSHYSYAPSTVTLNPSPPLTGAKYSKDRGTYQSSRLPSVRYPPEKNQAAKDERAERRAYGSFCPVSTARNTMAESEYAPNRGTRPDLEHSNRYTRADSEYDTQSVGARSFESIRVSAFPEEADFLKSKYSVRQSALDNWPLK